MSHSIAYNSAVNETYELLDLYVVEWFDSSQSRMYKDIEELKKELKERFIK